MLRTVFEKEKIEYFAALRYSDVKTVNERLLTRLGFEPKSVIVFLIPYYAGETENLSRYASSVDYHLVIRGITDRIIIELREKYPSGKFSGFGDHSPIAEQHAALIGGLGIAGDNGLLINEKYGSYVFIGDIITDVPPELIGAVDGGDIRKCSHCGACRLACPTGILRGENADCLSFITQKKGELSRVERELMRSENTAWGCDKCQTVCPYNYSAVLTPIPDFYEKRITLLSTDAVNAMTDEEFSRRAFSWRGRAVVLRNLSVIDTTENE